MKTKQKVYVLMISEFFPAYHPKAGQPTNFEDKIRSGEKCHTIRRNYTIWKKREQLINDGKAIISIRKWADVAYRSKHVELFRIQKTNVQKVSFINKSIWVIDEKERPDITTYAVSNLDGLDELDFKYWFNECPENLECIIHFGDFKY